MFFYDSLEVGHLIGVFLPFLELDKQIMQRVLFFFLTFRSNREIFFVVYFFSVKRVGGGMKGILLIIFVFLRENTISFQLFFKLITDVRSHIGLVWHFARFFLDLDFFSFVDDFFSQSDLFLFAFFFFLYFFS